MRFNPGVSWFAPFHDLHPSEDSKCIYFTLKETRCRWPSSNYERAIELYTIISSRPADDVGVELLEEYILCWCCKSGRAQHRDRIVDVKLLISLAERWQEEIRRHAAEQSSLAASVVQLGEGAILADDAASIPATGNSGRASSVYSTGIASPAQDRPDTAASSSISTTPPTSVASLRLWSCQAALLTSTNTSLGIPLQDFGGGPRYDLRSHETDKPTNAISVRPTASSFRPPLSEFRTHITEPDRSQCVSQQILNNLAGRDFETGSVYIFDRDSSPGHVKIGWTARSVSRRIEGWSECGYTPNLLFSVDNVPHAKRVETLTHYELIKEWRRERMCKGCEKSHEEWFEVSKERAEQVLGSWAEFMKAAEPYDSEGRLKPRWKDFVSAMKTEETLTAEKLMERYKLSLAEPTMPAGKPASPGRAPKLEKQEEGLKSTPKLEDLERYKVPSLVRLQSLPIRSTSTRIELPHQNVPARRTPAGEELSPEQIPLPPSPLLLLPPESPLLPPAKSHDADIHLSLEMDKLCVEDIIT
ncbi:T5orf172 domain-containing protein [Cladorrhinum sp. PSN259]|nr:T5orf172 domain-containing protein [Cladorrhinum sp. PSN259]